MSASPAALKKSSFFPSTAIASRCRAACLGFTGYTRYPAAASALIHGPHFASITTTTWAGSGSVPGQAGRHAESLANWAATPDHAEGSCAMEAP